MDKYGINWSQKLHGVHADSPLVSADFFNHIPRMQTATQNDFVTIPDYLATEEISEVRHEYLGGMVYAMAGETRDHNRILGNLYVQIREHLKGKPCQVYTSDIRVNFKVREDEYYYYPDIVVTCDKRDTDERFVRYPKLIIEIASPSTERIDRCEKFLSYTNIETLEEYILIPQNNSGITAFRREKNWRVGKVADEVITLASLQFTLNRAAIYEGV